MRSWEFSFSFSSRAGRCASLPFSIPYTTRDVLSENNSTAHDFTFVQLPAVRFAVWAPPPSARSSSAFVCCSPLRWSFFAHHKTTKQQDGFLSSSILLCSLPRRVGGQLRSSLSCSLELLHRYRGLGRRRAKLSRRALRFHRHRSRLGSRRRAPSSPPPFSHRLDRPLSRRFVRPRRRVYPLFCTYHRQQVGLAEDWAVCRLCQHAWSYHQPVGDSEDRDL